MHSIDDLLNLFRGQTIVFLENDNYLDELGKNLANFLTENKIPFECVFKVQKIGLRETLVKCRSANIIVFRTTWTYSVSNELNEAFMSINNPKFKKTFVELYLSEPSWFVNPHPFHDLYTLKNRSEDVNKWELSKLDRK